MENIPAQKPNSVSQKPQDLSVSAAAKILKISPTSLRRFEDEGKIKTQRNELGHRMYDQGEILALEAILEKEAAEKRVYREQKKQERLNSNRLPVSNEIAKNQVKIFGNGKDGKDGKGGDKNSNNNKNGTLDPFYVSFKKNIHLISAGFITASLILTLTLASMLIPSKARTTINRKITNALDVTGAKIAQVLNLEIKEFDPFTQAKEKEMLATVMGTRTRNPQYQVEFNVPTIANKTLSVGETLTVSGMATFNAGITTSAVTFTTPGQINNLLALDDVSKVSLEKILEISGDASGTLNNITIDNLGGTKVGTIEDADGSLLIIEGGEIVSGELADLDTTQITQIGVITEGTWNGSVIGPEYGGTGITSYATGDMIYASATNTLSNLNIGAEGQILTSVSGVPTWANLEDSLGDNLFIQGGNAFGVKAVLGTTDNFALGLITNNLERMTISATGNIGIGTTSPLYKLDIAGNTRIQANYDLIIKNEDLYGDMLGSRQYTAPNYIVSGETITESLKKLDDAVYDVSSASWVRIAGSRMYPTNWNLFSIMDSGRLGIGTSTPSEVLHVVGNAYLTGNISVGSGDTTISEYNIASEQSLNTQLGDNAGLYAYTIQDSDGTEILSIDTNGQLTHSGTTADFTLANGANTAFTLTGTGTGAIFRVNDVAGDTSPVVITGTGEVGIGTSTPLYKLHVDGDINYTGTLRINGSQVTTTHIPEGTHLYFLDSRARAAISGSSPITYDSVTGIFGIQQATTLQGGYLSSADWNTFNSKLTATLAEGSVFIGNSSNTATPRTVTGDITMSSIGVTTIGDDKVTGTKISLVGEATGSIMYFNGTDWVHLAADTSEKVLHTGATPSWGLVSLTSGVDGVLPIANGGTNTSATPTAGAVAYGTGTAIGYSTVGNSGQVLISNAAGAPSWADASSVGTNYWNRTDTTLSPLASGDYITTTGRIGAGTTTPGYTMDVSGDINFTGTLNANGQSGTAGQLLVSNGASSPTWQNLSGIIATSGWSLLGNTSTDPDQNYLGTGDAQPLIIKTNAVESARIDTAGNWLFASGVDAQIDKVTARSASGLALYDDGDNGVFIEDGGNVGIGNANPGYKLEVTGDLLAGYIHTTGNTIQATNNSGLALYDNASNGIFIEDGGYVGIGNTDPTSLFSVGAGSPFRVSSAGAIEAATGITSSGDVTLSGEYIALTHSDFTTSGGILKVNPTTGYLSLAIGSDLPSGSPDYIQNQITAAQTTSNFWISGTGIADVSLRTPLIETVTSNLTLDPSDGIIIARESLAIGENITTPGIHTLYVEGSMRLTGALYDSTDSAGASGSILTSTGSATEWKTIGTALDGDYFKQGGNSFGASGELGTNDAYDLQFETNGATAMTIDTDGNVGIGTTTPTAALQVAAPNTTAASLTWGAAAGTIFRSEGSELAMGLLDVSPYPYWIQARTSGSTARDIALQPLGGKVGIGTTTPSYTLDVAGDINFTGELRLSGSAGTAGQLIISQGDSASPIWSDISTALGDDVWLQNGNNFGATGVVGTNDAYDLQFETNGATAMTIDTDGNVGISTTSPTRTLEVAGDAYIQDDLYIGATTEAITNAGFALDGDDAYIHDLLGVGDSIYVENSVIVGTGTTTLSDGNITSTGGLNIDLGDALGVTSLNIRDSDDSNLFSVNSSGGITSAGTSASFTLNNGTDTAFLVTNSGTGDSFRINDTTGDTTPFVIDADGNVGIGTTAPSHELTVAGNIRTYGDPLTENEYFEDVSFPPTDWATGGDANWSRDTVVYQQGAASAASGVITHNGSSWIDAEYTFASPGTISFYWRVSSEANYDFLVFCTDNTNCSITSGYTNRISGTVDWTLVEYQVASAGTYTFRWLYAKDNIDSSGDDKGWIDNITFETQKGSILAEGFIQSGANIITGDGYGNFGGYPTMVLNTIPDGDYWNNVYRNLTLGEDKFYADYVDNNGNYLFIYNNGSFSVYTYGANINGDILIYHDLLTDTADTDNIGSTTAEWNSLYVADGSGVTAGGGIFLGNDQDFLFTYDETTSDALELSDGTNTFFSIKDQGTASDTAFNTDDLFIKSDGHVGIGTTSPSYALDVAGDINFTGELRLSGSAGTSGQLLISQGDAASPIWSDISTALGDNVWLQDGNSFGEIGVLGTNDAYDLQFETNGATAMTIDTDGNVGIGTTNPIGLLNILGDTEQLRLSYDTSNYMSFTIDATGQLALSDSGTSVATLSAVGAQFDVPATFAAAGEISMADDLVFTNQTSANIQSYGPLSIESGESFENNDLTLKTYGTGNVVADLTGTGYLHLLGTDTSVVFDSRTATDTDFWAGIVEDSDGVDDDVFGIGKGLVPGTGSLLTIDAAGNVGIGTTTPAAALDVSGDINLTGEFRLSGSAGTTGQLMISQGDAASPIWSDISTALGDNVWLQGGNSFGEIGVLGTNDAYDLQFETNGATAMTIDTDGYVGIGTTEPQRDLHILGNDIPIATNAQYAGNLLVLSDNAQAIDMGGSIGFGGRYTSSTNYWTFASIKGAKADSSNAIASGYLAFFTESSGNSTEKMRINSNGYVGIGTTSPQRTLHVAGNSRIDGILELSPTQIAKVLEASDAADTDLFGSSTALSANGSILAVGAYYWEGTTGSNRGGVYIYDWSGSAWIQRGSVLEASDATNTDLFGISTALSADGSILTVGANYWEGATGTDRGGVYIYDWSGSAWIQRDSVLEAGDAANSDYFGTSTALSADGSILAVGASGWEGSSGTNHGGVYIYDWSGSDWVQRGSVLEASDAADSDAFGIAISLSSDGSILAVGASVWEGAADSQGGVYIYDWSGSAWIQRGSVLEAGDAADSDYFGTSTALSSDGSILAVGASVWEGAADSQGGVYIYDWSGSAWIQRGSVLEAGDAADSDNFGRATALSADGSILTVGAYIWEGDSGSNRGGVYTYSLTANATPYGNMANGTGWSSFIANTLSANTGGVERLRINSNGYVGIGTTTPLFALDVVGDIHLTSQASSASTTEGTLYYDSDDDQLKVYANGKWQVDRSTATIIVGVNTGTAATSSKNYEKADYVGDGTNDEVEIEAAIAALPANGGTVVLLEGTYSIGSPINITDDDISLIGVGKSTLLQKAWDETSASSGVITINNLMHYITIANLQIDGVKATYTNNSYNHGIYSPDLQQSKIYNVWVINCASRGISLAGNIYDNLIQGNHLTANRYGLDLDGNNIGDNVISNNVIQDNVTGFSLTSSKNVVTGNDISNNTGAGIYSYGGDDNVISGNRISSNGTHGISLETDADRNTISDNTISSNTQHGISLYGSNNNVVNGNSIYNNGGSGAYDGISFTDDSNDNSISSNHITDTAGTGYAIDISAATVDNTYLAGNTYNGTGAATINDAGTGTVYGSQLANSGTDLLLTPSGNVGIGTTDPEALLQLGTPASSLGTLRLAGDTSGYVQIQPSTAAGDWILTLPANNGDNGQVLTTDGDGVTSWTTPASSGANTSLSNLDSTAINTSLISDAADTDDLGSATYEWNSLFLSDGSGLTAGGGLFLGNDQDFLFAYDEVTSDALELSDGTNTFFSIKDQGTTADIAFNTDDLFIGSTGSIGIGTASPSTKLHIIGTTEQLRLGYDTSNYTSFTVDSNGQLVLADTGTNIATFGSAQVSFDVPVAMASAGDVSIANNLNFTNITAGYITSDAPLYIQAGNSAEAESLYLASAGLGDVYVDDDLFVTQDIALDTGNSLILDNDDTADSYLAHDSANDWIEIWADGTESLRIKADGAIDADGTVSSNAYDVAESYPTYDRELSSGDIVMIATEETADGASDAEDSADSYSGASLVARANLLNRDKIVGIVSTAPAFTLGGGSFEDEFCAQVAGKSEKAIEQILNEYKDELLKQDSATDQESAESTDETKDEGSVDEEIADEESTAEEKLTEEEIQAKLSAKREAIATCQVPEKTLVALAGRVPLKVDIENGEIKPGDPLTIGNTQGQATKATSNGMIVARALESYTKEDAKADKKTIIAMIQVTWWNTPEASLATDIVDTNTAEGTNEDDASQPVTSPIASEITPEQLAALDIQFNAQTNSLELLNNLNVVGDTTVTDLTITGDLVAGTMKINSLENSIGIVGPNCYAESPVESLGEDKVEKVEMKETLDDSLCEAQALYLQKARAGLIDMFDGQVKFAPDGSIKAKSLAVAGQVKAGAYAVDTSEEMRSAGKITIKEGETSAEVEIAGIALTDETLIIATPNVPVAVGTEKIDDNKFGIQLDSPAVKDIIVSWWIIETE